MSAKRALALAGPSQRRDSLAQLGEEVATGNALRGGGLSGGLHGDFLLAHRVEHLEQRVAEAERARRALSAEAAALVSDSGNAPAR